MTFAEAVKLAKSNPGQGIREKEMQAKWKVVWIRWPKKGKSPAGGGLFCINPITGSDYHYTPTDADKASTKWTLI